MMDVSSSSTSTKVVGKLETLPKEELLKFIKKQAIGSKDLKKKIEELTNELKEYKDEINNLEKEKKDWISRGVSAEFEKKDRIVKKNKELELAAQLGKEMLAENDVLQRELDNLKQEHDDTMQDFEDEFEKVLHEKEVLEETLSAIHEEYKATKIQAQESKHELKMATEIHMKEIANLSQENKDFRSKVQDLEHQLNTSAVNLKLHKLKEKYDELSKETRSTKEAKTLLEEDLQKKSEQILGQDKEVTNLRREIAELQKVKRSDNLEFESLQKHNDELMKTLRQHQDENKQLDDELQKVKVEKEKLLKGFKNTKTKLERATQMEEELRKQLNIIVGERDSLFKKLQKKGQQVKSKSVKSPREGGLEKVVAEKDKLIKDLENHLAELERENSELQQRSKGFCESNAEIHERYLTIQKDFDNLSFEIDELTTKTNTLREEKNSLTKKNNELVEKNNSLHELHKSFVAEKDNWLVEKSTLESKLEELEGNSSRFATEKEQASKKPNNKSKVTKVKSPKAGLLKESSSPKTSPSKTQRVKDAQREDELQEQSGHFQLELEETKATILKLEARINELLVQLQKLNEEKHDQDRELEELFKVHDDLQNKYDFECQERQKNESEIMLLETKLSEFSSNQNIGKEQVSIDLEEQISHLREELQEEQKLILRFQQEVQVKDEQIFQLRNDLEELQRQRIETNVANNKEVDNIFLEFEQLDQQFTKTKQELTQARDEIETLKLNISKSEVEKTKAIETLTVTAKKLIELKKDYDGKSKELSLLREQLDCAGSVTERKGDEDLSPRMQELNAKITLLNCKVQEQEDLRKDNDSLRANLETFQQELEPLRQNVVSLQEENDLLRERFQALQQQSEPLHENPETLRDEEEALRQEIISLSTDLQTFDSEYKRLTAENKHLKESFERMINIKSELQSVIEDLGTKFKRSEYEVKMSKASLEFYDQLKSHVKCESNEEFENYVKSKESMKIYMDKLESENRKVTDELQLIKRERENLLSNFDTALVERNQFEAQLAQVNAIVDSLTDQLGLEKSKQIDLETSLKNVQEEFLAIKNEFELTNQEKIELLQKMEIQRETYSLKNDSIECVNNDTSTSVVSDDIIELQRTINAKDVLIHDLEETIDDLKTQNDKKQKDFKATIEELTQNHSVTCQELFDRECRLKEDMEKLNDDAKAKVVEKQSEVDRLSAANNELESTFEGLHSQLKVLQDTVDGAKFHNEKLNHDFIEVTESLTSLENENKTLTDELNDREQLCARLQYSLDEKIKLLQSAKDASVNENQKTENEDLKIQHEKLEFELQSALNRIDELETELNSAHAKLSQVEEKSHKFRSLAIKVKKELEAARSQQESDKSSFEEQMESLFNQSREMKNDLVRQKTECGKHEEEFEVMQNEIKTLQEELETQSEKVKNAEEEKRILEEKIDKLVCENTKYENTEETSTTKFNDLTTENEKLTKKLTEANTSLLAMEERLKAKSSECEKLAKASESLQTNLASAQKESQKMTLMNLEMNDCHRTIESLRRKASDQQKTIEADKSTIETLKTAQEQLRQELNTLKKHKLDADEKLKKFKSLIVKLKKDLADTQKNENEAKMQIEKLNQSCDGLKIQLAETTNSYTSKTEQLKTQAEFHEKTYQTLGVKLARVNSDLLSSQKLYSDLQSEYENYKVRAHNVLKQQRETKIDSEKETDNIERTRLEETNEQLKQKLQETVQRLSVLQCDYGELEVEHERLQNRHNQFVHEISEKENEWKEKFETLKSEKASIIFEYNNNVCSLTKENDSLLKSTKETSDLMKTLEEDHVRETKTLKEQLHALQQQLEVANSHRLQSHSPPKTLTLHKQDSNEFRRSDTLIYVPKTERQEGEGMDQRDLELIDTISQQSSAPPTPMSPTNAAVLEKILSPGESSDLTTPQTPGSLRDELLNLRSLLTTSMKKNEHLTALLGESETNASRLDEQAKVLKDEIRRLERNEQREQALSNMEYLKNVIIQFLKVGHAERSQLIPVLCTMLKLSNEEKTFLSEYARGDGAGDDDAADDSSWSSYVYRWTSLS